MTPESLLRQLAELARRLGMAEPERWAKARMAGLVARHGADAIFGDDGPPACGAGDEALAEADGR